MKFKVSALRIVFQIVNVLSDFRRNEIENILRTDSREESFSVKFVLKYKSNSDFRN